MRIFSILLIFILLFTTTASAQEETAMNYTDPKVLPKIDGMPDLFTFLDGTKVETREDWQKRKAEIKGLYEYYLYGYLPKKSGEQLSYALTPLADASGYDMEITVQAEGKTASFTVTVTLPKDDAPAGGVGVKPPEIPVHKKPKRMGAGTMLLPGAWGRNPRKPRFIRSPRDECRGNAPAGGVGVKPPEIPVFKAKKCCTGIGTARNDNYS